MVTSPSPLFFEVLGTSPKWTFDSEIAVICVVSLHLDTLQTIFCLHISYLIISPHVFAPYICVYIYICISFTSYHIAHHLQHIMQPVLGPIFDGLLSGHFRCSARRLNSAASLLTLSDSADVERRATILRWMGI